MKRMMLSCLLLIFLAPYTQAESTFLAGYGQRDITPPAGLPMWGYGARHDLPAEGTLDPLYAKCVVLQVDDDKIAIMGLDLGRAPTFAQMAVIREGVKKAGVGHVMLSGSHTHHGPVIELIDEPGYGQGKFDNALEYNEKMTALIIEAIVEAAESVQPARIGWASEDVPYNRNRQAKVEPKPRDPELAVIRIDKMDGSPLATIVNFAAHPVWIDILDRRWSAEWPGQMALTVEEATGAPCIFMQGAAGDMSPNGEGARGHIELGQLIGRKVLEINERIETSTPKTPAIHAKPEDKFSYETRIDLENPLIRGTFSQMFFPEILAMLEELPNNTITPRLKTVLINEELALVGGSGEFFAEHATRLKNESPAAKTLFFGYCNGHQMYFPTLRAIEEGGYGADPSVSWVPPGAGEEIIDKAVANIKALLETARSN